MTEIQEIKEHLRPINIASVSFGKDSTATLQLVLEAMKGTGTKLYIVTSDTKMEIPFYEDYLNRQREKVQRYISENGINAEMVMVYPEPHLALKKYKEVYCSMSNNTAYRSRIRRNGEEGAGPFLVTIREDLYRDLKKLEARTGWQLITPDEEAQIFKHWEEDRAIHNVACNDWPILFPVETER